MDTILVVIINFLILISDINGNNCREKDLQMRLYANIGRRYKMEVVAVRNGLVGHIEVVDDLSAKQEPYVHIDVRGHVISEINSVSVSSKRLSNDVILVSVFQKPSGQKQDKACPLVADITLHVPTVFLKEGSSLTLNEQSKVLYENWIHRIPIQLWHYSKDSPVPKRDKCGEKDIVKPCDFCHKVTGDCYCPENYLPLPSDRNLCTKVTSTIKFQSAYFKKGFNIVTGEPSKLDVFRYTFTSARTTARANSQRLLPDQLNVIPESFCTSKQTELINTVTTYSELRKTQWATLSVNGLKASIELFGKKDCKTNNGGCPGNLKCISDRFLDTGACVCPHNLYVTRDGQSCYDPKKSIDCSDGVNGGCEHVCLNKTSSIGTYEALHMYCGCNAGYRLVKDGRSCERLHACNKEFKGGCVPVGQSELGQCVTNTSDPDGSASCVCTHSIARNVEICREDISAGACVTGMCVPSAVVTCAVKNSKGQCYSIPTKVFQTFRRGFNWKTQKLGGKGIFELTYSTNYDFAPKVIPDEVKAEEFSEKGGCEYKETEIESYENTMSHLEMVDSSTKGGSVGFQLDFSIPVGPVAISTGVGFSKSWSESRYEQKKQSYEKKGYTKTQTVSVLNEHFALKWKNNRKILPGFKAAVGRLSVKSPASDFINFFERFGTHYFEHVIYGYESKYVLHYSNNSTFSDLQDYYKKTKTSSSSFNLFGFSSSSFKSSTESRASGVTKYLQNGKLHIDWSEKGACPSACDKCESDSDSDTLAIVKTPVVAPIEKLVEDKDLQLAMYLARLGYLWCNGKGQVVDGKWCRCDANVPDCSPLTSPSPSLKKATDSSLTIEWKNTQQLIGSHVTNYEIAYVEKTLYADKVINPFSEGYSYLRFNDDGSFLKSSATPCDGIRSMYHRGNLETFSKNGVFQVSIECLKPDTEYSIAVRAESADGRTSESGVFTSRTSCEVLTETDIQGSYNAIRQHFWFNRAKWNNVITLLRETYSPIRLALLEKYYNNLHGSGKFDDFLKDYYGNSMKRQVRNRIAQLPARCKLYSEPTKFRAVAVKRKVSVCDFSAVDSTEGYRQSVLDVISLSCRSIYITFNTYKATGS